jgi:hypothetical protein
MLSSRLLPPRSASTWQRQLWVGAQRAAARRRVEAARRRAEAAHREYLKTLGVIAGEAPPLVPAVNGAGSADERLMLRAVELLAAGHSQRGAARIMSISAATVNRLAAKARVAGLLPSPQGNGHGSDGSEIA